MSDETIVRVDKLYLRDGKIKKGDKAGHAIRTKDLFPVYELTQVSDEGGIKIYSGHPINVSPGEIEARYFKPPLENVNIFFALAVGFVTNSSSGPEK